MTVRCRRAGADPLIGGGPGLLVEVVSPSAEVTGRRDKVVVCRRIPSLKACLIVDQDQQRVERRRRDEDGVGEQTDVAPDFAGAAGSGRAGAEMLPTVFRERLAVRS